MGRHLGHPGLGGGYQPVDPLDKDVEPLGQITQLVSRFQMNPCRQVRITRSNLTDDPHQRVDGAGDAGSQHAEKKHQNRQGNGYGNQKRPGQIPNRPIQLILVNTEYQKSVHLWQSHVKPKEGLATNHNLLHPALSPVPPCHERHNGIQFAPLGAPQTGHSGLVSQDEAAVGMVEYGCWRPDTGGSHHENPAGTKHVDLTKKGRDGRRIEIEATGAHITPVTKHRAAKVDEQILRFGIVPHIPAPFFSGLHRGVPLPGIKLVVGLEHPLGVVKVHLALFAGQENRIDILVALRQVVELPEDLPNLGLLVIQYPQGVRPQPGLNVGVPGQGLDHLCVGFQEPTEIAGDLADRFQGTTMGLRNQDVLEINLEHQQQCQKHGQTDTDRRDQEFLPDIEALEHASTSFNVIRHDSTGGFFSSRNAAPDGAGTLDKRHRTETGKPGFSS